MGAPILDGVRGVCGDPDAERSLLLTSIEQRLLLLRQRLGFCNLRSRHRGRQSVALLRHQDRHFRVIRRGRANGCCAPPDIRSHRITCHVVCPFSVDSTKEHRAISRELGQWRASER